VIRLRLRHSLRHDEGVAMLFVIAIGFVVTILAVAMLSSVLQNQRTTRLHRNVTSAQAAAEAGLDDAVYQLGQFNSSGVSNWTALSSGSSAWTAASPNVQTFGANASYKTWITNETTSGGASTGNLIIWSKGTYGANTRTIRALVTQGAPPAFDFSMFASKGIDIHHHSSYLTPQVWTTAVHSNGYINIDASSEFTVKLMSAVGALTFQKGTGSTPGGSITTAGYNWYDPLNGKCYPGGMSSPGGIAPSSGTTCPYSYNGEASVAGTIHAGSVTMGSRGMVLPVPSDLTLDTGQVIPAQTGDITAGSASINGTNYTAAGSPVTCAACGKGSAVAAGQVAGSLTVTPGYTPDVIPFPSIDYSTTYRPKAQAEGHYYTSPSTFLTDATTTTSNFWNVASDGTMTRWDTNATTKAQMPNAIVLDGTYDITGGSLSLDYGTIQKNVQTATGRTGSAPILIIRGALVVETGGLDIGTPFAMVGAGNRVDFTYPGTASTPVTIDTTKLLDSAATMPAVLATGGAIDSHDYDTDSPWSSASSYEPSKASPVYIRGLVYSASWNATTKTSTPQSQHWHNFDPKNLMKIYGAQVGAQLHDCNNFNFSYDPLIKNAFGFGGGSVKVLDYQELGS
jgi:Tfp pilus assembly protein PilX